MYVKDNHTIVGTNQLMMPATHSHRLNKIIIYKYLRPVASISGGIHASRLAADRHNHDNGDDNGGPEIATWRNAYRLGRSPSVISALYKRLIVYQSRTYTFHV